MGWKVNKQKNGKYAIWSTVTDSDIFYDCSHAEVIECFVERGKDQRIVEAKRQIAFADLADEKDDETNG